MKERSTSDLTLFRRLFAQARPFWGHIGVIMGLGLLSTPLALLTPVPLKIAVDSFTGHHSLPGFLDAFVPDSVTSSQSHMLMFAAGMVVVVALLNQVVDLTASLLRTYTGEKLVLDFRARLFRHVQRLSISFHDTRGTSDSIYRIQWDAPSIQHVAIDGLVPFISAMLTVIAMVAVTVMIDWELALVALLVAPCLIAISRFYRRPLRRRYQEVKELETSTLQVLQEALGAIRVVKAFAAEEREQTRFWTKSGRGTHACIRLALFQSGLDILVALTTALGTASVLLVGGLHVQSGQITVGELLVVMAYLTQLYAPLRTVSNKAADIQASLASADRAFSLLDEAPDVAEKEDGIPVARSSGAFAFRNVSFAYEGGRPILDGVAIDIAPGTKVGIAGATGAGKTTLVSLLSRFYDPTGGAILLDGVDLRDYRLADLRNQFSIVLQEPVLFSTTIEENIAYAREGATHEDVVAAAKAASIHEFIAALPEGYDTTVGERGMRLSGGERQRISLARAYLKDAPILVLDEPTSSVDVQTEADIVGAMERLMEGRTTFIIAHRLTTLQHCDVRLALRNGHLAEEKPAEQVRRTGQREAATGATA